MGLQEEKQVDGLKKDRIGRIEAVSTQDVSKVLNTLDYWENQGCSEKERQPE